MAQIVRCDERMALSVSRHRAHRLPLHKLKGPLRRAKHWLAEMYSCIDRTRTLGLAAETAFWLFLALLPLLAIAGLVAARLSLDNWHRVTPILESLPPAARQFITTELVKVSEWDENAVGVAGALTFLWLASSGMHAIFDALEVETGASRGWLRKRMLAFGACIGLSLSIALLAVLGPGIEAAFTDVGQRLPFLASLSNLVAGDSIWRWLMSFGILVAQTYGLYWVGIPPQARVRMPLWPGVLTTAALQAILSLGYTSYLSAVGDGAAYTAGLTIVGLILTALYLFVLALLIGAIVNRMLGDFRADCKE